MLTRVLYRVIITRNYLRVLFLVKILARFLGNCSVVMCFGSIRFVQALSQSNTRATMPPLSVSLLWIYYDDKLVSFKRN